MPANWRAFGPVFTLFTPVIQQSLPDNPEKYTLRCIHTILGTRSSLRRVA